TYLIPAAARSPQTGRGSFCGMAQAASPTTALGSDSRKASIDGAVMTVLPSILRASSRPAAISLYNFAWLIARRRSTSRGEYSQGCNALLTSPQEATDIGCVRRCVLTDRYIFPKVALCPNRAAGITKSDARFKISLDRVCPGYAFYPVKGGSIQRRL